MGGEPGWDPEPREVPCGFVQAPGTPQEPRPLLPVNAPIVWELGEAQQGHGDGGAREGLTSATAIRVLPPHAVFLSKVNILTLACSHTPPWLSSRKS